MLIVESDPTVRASLHSWFRGAGYSIVQLPAGASKIRAFEAAHPDLVLIDQTSDGLVVLGALRERSTVPIMAIATSNDTEATRIGVLELGADDVVAPGREMLARARALLRRIARQVATDELFIDLQGHQVRKGDQRIDLPKREFEVLAFLASSPRRVFSHMQIMDGVWGAKSSEQRITTVAEHVYRIRHRIEDDPVRPRYVVTVRGAGYRFEP